MLRAPTEAELELIHERVKAWTQPGGVDYRIMTQVMLTNKDLANYGAVSQDFLEALADSFNGVGNRQRHHLTQLTFNHPNRMLPVGFGLVASVEPFEDATHFSSLQEDCVALRGVFALPVTSNVWVPLGWQEDAVTLSFSDFEAKYSTGAWPGGSVAFECDMLCIECGESARKCSHAVESSWPGTRFGGPADLIEYSLVLRGHNDQAGATLHRNKETVKLQQGGICRMSVPSPAVESRATEASTPVPAPKEATLANTQQAPAVESRATEASTPVPAPKEATLANTQQASTVDPQASVLLQTVTRLTESQQLTITTLTNELQTLRERTATQGALIEEVSVALSLPPGGTLTAGGIIAAALAKHNANVDDTHSTTPIPSRALPLF